jgi:putative SOS response-associated peptidase YedK
VCGRYSVARPDEDLAKEFKVASVIGTEPEPSWNVAATQTRRVVLERAPRDDPDAPAERMLRNARWGLVPSWAKDIKIGNRLINARAETVTSKPSFKAAARRRRCLIPADGYYEWEKVNGNKVPYFLHHSDDLLAFAGLYELWPDPGRTEDDPDRWLWSYTILTTTAPDSLGHIHDRSPVLLPPTARDQWLDPRLDDADDVQRLLAELDQPTLEPRQVSTEVNSVTNNGPKLVQSV